ncbi:MAG TPA: phage antirepressor N-terminal domain-containing protein, partial [Ktedonobacterales bacterium]|nr:phage antirepressor N-terminal domain-containing protein [Ktedonobacterales bacterium]
MPDDEHDQESRFVLPQEDVIEQRTISFMGDEIIAALTISGVYLSVPGMCVAMGLGTNGQIRRMLNTNKLRVYLRELRLMTRGGKQFVTCLFADQVPMWLIGVESSKAKPAFQEKIDLYHDKLAPVALAVFQDVMGSRAIVPATQPPALAADLAALARLVTQYDELASLVLDLRDHVLSLASVPDQLDQVLRMVESLATQQGETTRDVEKLKAKTAGLTSAQQAKIREAIEIIVRDSEGKSGMLDYADVYRALYRHFAVSSYKHIPESRYDDAIRLLRESWRHATDGE